ncbi:MAG TPA: Ig-like domain-containing protein, partial [Myxococcota bacterium]|nr:Ig-like domain-containing protein [Myxococcota bacterium]
MRRILLGVALGAVGLRAAPARACGQSTHVWIGLHAVEHLPPGELRDLLAGEEHRLQLVNGAMFPDGGYSPIVRDDYGEMAHWEPFQTSLLDHVRAEHGWPLDADGEDEAAFLFGLAAHGMADQVFDGVYLTRSQVYDAEGWQTYSVDTSSDVVLVAREGPAEVLDRWAPWDLLVELFAQAGHTVDADTMMSGQGSLQVALRAVAISAADPETEAEYESQFPWAHAHMLDPSVPGSPACIGEVVAAYWQTMWDRLQGRFDMDADPVISTWPEAGSAGHPLAAADIEARVSLVFSRAIDASTLPERIVVTDAAGEVVPTDARLYYGDGSNVLNLWPLQDWVDGETYTVVVSEGLTSFDGVVLGAPWAMTFMAGAAPAAPVAGCGCASGG